MKLWPIIPIASAFCLGAFAAKTSSPNPAKEPSVIAAAPQDTSILPKRTSMKETLRVLPVDVLDKISFKSLVDGKITPIARPDGRSMHRHRSPHHGTEVSHPNSIRS